MNHTIQFAFKIIVNHQEKQEFEVRNKQSRTSKQVPTRDCLRETAYAASPTLSYVYAYAKPTHQAE